MQQRKALVAAAGLAGTALLFLLRGLLEDAFFGFVNRHLARWLGITESEIVASIVGWGIPAALALGASWLLIWVGKTWESNKETRGKVLPLAAGKADDVEREMAAQIRRADRSGRYDVWVYEAAHYIVTMDWSAPTIVGYGVEVGRLIREGTTLFRTEVNIQTGEQKVVPYTPEEEALAIRNGRTESVNRALEDIRKEAARGLPIWSVQDVGAKPILIDKLYWTRYGFNKIKDLKNASLNPRALQTESKQPPHSNAIYHSLRTNRKKVEELWPSKNI